MTDRELFLTREAQARADAGEASLANVRERCLRAAEAWGAMAERALKVEGMRQRLDDDKRAAAAAAAGVTNNEYPS